METLLDGCVDAGTSINSGINVMKLYIKENPH